MDRLPACNLTKTCNEMRQNIYSIAEFPFGYRCAAPDLYRLRLDFADGHHLAVFVVETNRLSDLGLKCSNRNACGGLLVSHCRVYPVRSSG